MRARPLRGVLRFVASVLITSGVLMLLDAALTVTWQEPVSALLANRAQDRLGDELDEAARRFGPPSRSAPSPRELRRLAAASRRRTGEGDAIGRISFPTLDRRYVMVQGTGTAPLREGPGHYPKTSFPGEGGTVAVAGHRTTYLAPFRTIDRLRRGERIVLEMPYARLVYRVEAERIVPPTATHVTNRVPGRERLVLSACHPLYSAAQRIIVFARLSEVLPA